jgi:hypothetical protein
MEITGLPLHALVVHASVVLVPLTALLAIAFAVLPGWRWLSRWPSAVAAVVCVPLLFLTVKSGEALEEDRHLEKLVTTHAARGHLLPGPSGLASGKGAMVSRVSYADKVLPVLVVVAALVVLVQVVLTGDSGARAVWGN